MHSFKSHTTFLFIAMAMLSGCSSEQESQAPKAVAPAAAPAEQAAVAKPEPVAASAGRSGEEIYNKSCTTCHAAGIAGAPRLGDPAGWTERIAKGTEALYITAKNGLNAMPPKGLCMDCTDEELNAAVDYMLDNSK
jgi:cytochrome c5